MRGGGPDDEGRRELLGRGLLIFGDAARGGEGTFGDEAFGGDSTLGGEYVRGEPRCCGDLKPVGDAIDGKGMPVRAFTLIEGVPTICSGSVLKSRGTAEGIKDDADAVEDQSLRMPNPTEGLPPTPTLRFVPESADSVRSRMVPSSRRMVTWTALFSISGFTVCTPRIRYSFLPLLGAGADEELETRDFCLRSFVLPSLSSPSSSPSSSSSPSMLLAS